MSKWNDFCRSFIQVTEKAMKKAEKLSDATALRVKIKTLEGKLSEQYEHLGTLTYAGIKGSALNKEASAKIVAKIDFYLAEIAAYKLKLSKIESDEKTEHVHIYPATRRESTSESDVYFRAPSAFESDEDSFPEPSSDVTTSEDADPKLEEAIRIVLENQKVSTSLLQRKLGIGYGRAAKLIDRMEELGVVGEANGNARAVLLPCPSDNSFSKKITPFDPEDDEAPLSDGIPMKNPFSLPTPDEDEKLIEAIELALENQKISTSLLQRRLEIGYGRAAKLIDRMEELGWISVPNGNSAREVFVDEEKLAKIKASLEAN